MSPRSFCGLVTVSLLLSLAGCLGANPAADDDGDCNPGQEGCACEDAACDPGLVCSTGDLCVEPGAGNCGDAKKDPGEECDQGDKNANEAACKADCTLQVCGDGQVGPGELCDDGNDLDDDACTNDCTLGSCGDGQVQGAEECDDGNDVDTDACLSTCVEASCGDGRVHDGVEACDDGNDDDDDGCTSTCELGASCGDASAEPGELCYEKVAIASAGDKVRDLAIFDTNADAHLDIVYLYEQSGSSEASRVGVAPGKGDGSFMAHIEHDAGGVGPRVLTVGDLPLFEVDGTLDVVVGHSGSKSMTILEGTGNADPAFETAVEWGTYDYPVHDIVAGLFQAADQRTVVLEHPEGGIGAKPILDQPFLGTCGPWEFNVTERPHWAERLERDSLDHDLVAVALTGEAKWLRIFEPDVDASGGDPCWLLRASKTIVYDIRYLVTADLDGDGDDEVIASADDGLRVYAVTGDPPDTAEELHHAPSTDPLSGLAAGDLDGDGDLDVVAAIPSTDQIRIYLGDGTGALTAADTFDTSGLLPDRVAIGDLDEDSVLDIVSTNRNTDNLSIFLSDP